MATVSTAALGRDYTVKGGVVYAEPDGVKLKMMLYLPSDSAPTPGHRNQEAGGTGAAPVGRPVVLLLHGGAWLFGTRHQLHWYGQHLAEQGYVAVSISYRMMPKYRFPDCLYDCKAAVRWLRLHANEYGIDPNRIGVLGNSAGGHLAALLATTGPENGFEGDKNLGEGDTATGRTGVSSSVQAVVDLYGVSDLTYYRRFKAFLGLGRLSRSFMRDFVGTRQDGQDPYVAASPMTYVSAKTCPILFLHGSRDHLVPQEQSVRFSEKLKELGVPTRFISVKHGHAFDFFYIALRATLFKDMVAFLDEHLAGVKPG